MTAGISRMCRRFTHHISTVRGQLCTRICSVVLALAFGSSPTPAQTGPEFNSINVNDSAVDDGSIRDVYLNIDNNETFTVRAEVRNAGDLISPAGYNNISMSVEQFTSDSDKTYIECLSRGPDLTFGKYFGTDFGGGPDWYYDYVFVESCSIANWLTGDSKWLQISIRPPRYGEYVIYVRAAMSSLPYWDSGWIYNPGASTYVDCTNIPAKRIVVHVQPGCIVPEAPTSLAPAPNVELQAGSITLQWDEANDATSYEIEGFDNADFLGEPVISDSTTQTQYTWDSPASGSHSWRVRARNDDNPAGCNPDAVGPWSSSKFTVVNVIDTGFRPTINGFHFANGDHPGGGDCVGMTYGAYYYFARGITSIEDDPDCNGPVSECGSESCSWPERNSMLRFRLDAAQTIYFPQMALQNALQMPVFFANPSYFFELHYGHVKQSLLEANKPRPIMVSVNGHDAHALLVYKIEERGSERRLYVYDSNITECDECYIELKVQNGTWTMKPYSCGWRVELQRNVFGCLPPVDEIVTAPMAVVAKCPVELEVAASDGRVINREVNEIGDAVYFEDDRDADGEMEKYVTIDYPDATAYSVRLRPYPDAPDSARFSCFVLSFGDTVLAVVENEIAGIPVDGYGVSCASAGIFIEDVQPATEDQPWSNWLPDAARPIFVSATIASVIDIDSATLYYRNSDGVTPDSWTNVAMSATGEGGYEGTIPAPHPQRQVDFYVSASDTAERNATMPLSAPTDYFSVAIGFTSIYEMQAVHPDSTVQSNNYVGKVLNIRGVVTAAGASQTGSGGRFVVQELAKNPATDSFAFGGVLVHDYSAWNPLYQGDVVEVGGHGEEYYGLTKMVPHNRYAINLVGMGHELPEPAVVHTRILADDISVADGNGALGEAWESVWVKTFNSTVMDTIGLAQRHEFTISDTGARGDGVMVGTFEALAYMPKIGDVIRVYSFMDYENDVFKMRLIDDSYVTYGDMSAVDNSVATIEKAGGFRSVHPNPFNPTINIKFSVSRAELVQLNVYNIRGEKVRTLIQDRVPANEYTIMWDGTDDSGRTVASGSYFARLRIGAEVMQVRKMQMIR